MAMHLARKPWWKYVDSDLREHLRLASYLADKSTQWSKRFHDYSFIVFPAAKAYEGFLKKLFLDMGFITKDEFYGKHFRIGKALNPALEEKYRDDGWVYARLYEYCGGADLPEKLWKTWRKSRNKLFHWFPDQENYISHPEAVERFLMIVSSIDEVFSACKIELDKKKNEKN